MAKAFRVALALGAMAAAVPAAAPAAAQNARPNIVLIYADDMGWGDASANAASWVKTPNIDAIAADGIRFTDGYSVAPVCGPSRTGLLTGAYPARFGTWWNPDTGKTRMPATQALLPDLVRKAGYTSAVVGKWNLAVAPEKYADVVNHKMTWGGAYWPTAAGERPGVSGGSGGGGEPSGLWAGPKPTDEYLTDMLTDDAVRFIDAQAGGAKPFFLYLAYNAPHSPLQAQEKYRARVAHLPTEPQRLYAAMILSMDEGIGRVRAELKKKGLDKNTVVMFASDNGPAKGGFRGYKPEWPAKMQLGVTGPLSGGKGTFREGGIREPFMISWPAAIRAGQVRSDPVSTVDLYRTIAAISGATIPQGSLVDGVDLSGVLKAGAPLAPRNMFWAGRICNRQGCKDSGALRNGDWKLLIEDGGAPKLFNLKSDVGEKADLSAKDAARAEAMTASYMTWKATLPPNASGTAGKPGAGGDDKGDDAPASKGAGAGKGGPCMALPQDQRAACRAQRKQAKQQ